MSERRKSPAVPLAVAAVAAIALVATLVGSGGSSDSDAPGTEEVAAGPATADARPDDAERAPAETWERLVRRDADDPQAMGEVDAPVVMLAYSEFQCPFCGKFARDTAPTLIEEYVEAGTLRIEWRDFPYLGAESTVAALGGRAAAAQDRFWDFHDELYDHQLPPNSGNLDEDYVAGIAERAGLDVDRFREDLGSEAAERAIAEDFAEGQAIGVTGTPAFVINGVPVIGAQPVEVFEDVIEQAAAEAR